MQPYSIKFLNRMNRIARKNSMADDQLKSNMHLWQLRCICKSCESFPRIDDTETIKY